MPNGLLFYLQEDFLQTTEIDSIVQVITTSTIFSKGHLSDESIWVLPFQINNFLFWGFFDFIGGGEKGSRFGKGMASPLGPDLKYPGACQLRLEFGGLKLQPSVSAAVPALMLRVKRESQE